MMVMAAEIALRLHNLRVNFYTYDGVVKAIDGVDLDLRRGETLGLVGETGCGKSVTVQSIVRLIPEPPGKIESGDAYLHMPNSEWQRMLDLEKKFRRSLPALYGPEDGMQPLLDLGTLRALRRAIHKGRAQLTTLADQGNHLVQNAVKNAGAATAPPERVAEIRRQARSALPVLNDLIHLKEQYDVIWRGPKALRNIRGNRIAMIFQEPGAALNPVLSVVKQVGEIFVIHSHDDVCDAALQNLRTAGKQREKTGRRFTLPIYGIQERFLSYYRRKPESRLLRVANKIPLLRRWRRWLTEEVRRRALRMLRLVRIPNPEEVLDQYPHELSGGMQQRVLIAMALAANPEILIADEPTTALDVTIQAQILKLMQALKEQYESSIIFITHDLAVIAQVCDRVSVMYAGTICEVGEVWEIFKEPMHPYTQGLVRAVPRPDADVTRLEEIHGTVPNLIFPPSGCRFHPRCPFAKDYCKDVKPTLMEVGDGHNVACHIYGPEGHLWESRDE